MLTDTKILLCINMAGSVRHTNPEPTKYTYYMTKQDYSKKQLPKTEGKEVVKKKSFLYKDKIAVPAILAISLSNTFFNYAISSDAWTPTIGHALKVNKKKYSKLSITTRLEYHLQQICTACNGISYTYSIIDD